MSWRQKEPEKAGEKGGLDERVPPSLKKFTSTAHSSARRTITQLSFKRTPNSEKTPHIYQPLQGSHGEFMSAGSERKICFTWHPDTSVRDACPQRRTG